jgi:predicted acetyltransferase
MISQFTDKERQQIVRIWRQAFNMSPERAEIYMANNRWENVRAVERKGEVASCLVICDFGQYFGGRSIRSAGIAAVGAAVHHRSKGTTRTLMHEMLREQYERGTPLSTLYPSTRTLYRRVGFETAGAIHHVDVETRRLDARASDVDLVPIDGTRETVVDELHRRFAAANPGNLDRTRVMWHRIRFDREAKPSDGYVIEVDGSPEGYFYFRREESATSSYTIDVWDMAAPTPRAAKRFLQFLADNRAQADRASWWGSPVDSVLLTLNEQAYKVRLLDEWMVRIVDVAKALAQRGYPPYLRCELHLEIGGDEVVPENNGRFVLEVDKGAARVKEGGSGRLRVSIRGLSPLFTGYYAPETLRSAGLLETEDDESLALARALFAGPTPWMRDKF